MRESSQKSSAEVKTRAPKQQRGHERVAILLDAAARVFFDKGYEAATMTEIAAEAQSSIGSLYQFFPTKPLLAEALSIERLERLSSVLHSVEDAAAGHSAADVGEMIFVRLEEFMQDFPEFAVLAARRDIPKDRKARSRAELKERIAAILCRAEPSVSHEVDLLAAIVLEVLRIAVTTAKDPEATEDQQLVRELRLMLRKRLDEASVRG